MRILISACLLGARCRYDGVSKLQPWISDLAERHILVPVCPEQLGGLPTPRPPAERRGDRAMSPPNTAGARKRPCVSAACWDARRRC